VKLKRHKWLWLAALVLSAVISVTWQWYAQQKIAHTVIVWMEPHYDVSEAFLGVAIDAAMLTNGDWWEGSDSPPRPIDMTNPDLLKWTALLQPDWVRLGGTEADKLLLVEDYNAQAPTPQLTRADLTAFLNFVEQVNARPFITISTGPRVRLNEQWQSAQLQRLLSWLPPSFEGMLEFGNEPGAHWLMFGHRFQVSFEQLAKEYQQARVFLQARSDIQLAAPGNAFWPEIGEPLKQVVGSSKDFLQAGANPDVFTWHYYPTQSSRCTVRIEGANWEGLLDNETFDEFAKHSKKVKQWLAQYSPASKQWLGETGPAQCGGKAKLTDRFGASLWWLSHLATAVQNGNETVIRQSLVGGDYALLTYRDGYSPTPDFWASLLWQRNMGVRGFVTLDNHKNIRVAAHCHKTKPGTLAMVIVNLSKQTHSLSIPQLVQGQYLDVTSMALESRYTLVEQRLAESLNWVDGIDRLPWVPIKQWRDLTPYSYRWVLIDDVSQCQA
jgi:heparanase 1